MLASEQLHQASKADDNRDDVRFLGACSDVAPGGGYCQAGTVKPSTPQRLGGGCARLRLESGYPGDVVHVPD